jgi:hypothetical protein
MKLLVPGIASLLVFAMATGTQAAPTSTLTGWPALALAQGVGAQSTTLSSAQKTALARSYDGRLASVANRTILVRADRVTCTWRDWNFNAARRCTLTFGSRNVSLTGRPANDLIGILYESQALQDRAMGGQTGYVFADVVCTVNIAAMRSSTFGNTQGVRCTFVPS